jgi:hypothetical protein
MCFKCASSCAVFDLSEPFRGGLCQNLNTWVTQSCSVFNASSAIKFIKTPGVFRKISIFYSNTLNVALYLSLN